MHLIFCDNFLNPREPDEVYAVEFAAAPAAGFSCGLVSFEGLTGGEGCDLAFTQTVAGGPSQRNAERHGFATVYSRARMVRPFT